MFPLPGIGPGIAAATPSEPASSTLSTAEILARISAIDAHQIELIGHHIAYRILHKLGPAAKAKIVQQVMQKRGTGANTTELDSGKTQFFSNADAARFLRITLGYIQQAMTASFSTPFQFVESGLAFQLTDHQASGILEATANAMGISLTFKDVPSEYCIFFKLDEELTRENGNLVFELIECSEGVELSRLYYGEVVRARRPVCQARRSDHNLLG